MFKKVGDFFAEKISKILPDSFVFAIILTIVTMILAHSVADASAMEILTAWIKGVFDSNIIFFGFLMIMVLTFGYSIGMSPPVIRFFNYISRFISKPWQVYTSIVVTGMLLMLINWGLAPVIALFTVELCKRVKGVDYRLACTATYSGMIIWHGGMSASAPLMMATEQTAKGFIDQGLIEAAIPVSQSLLGTVNFALIGVTFILLPVIILFLMPSEVDEKWDAAALYEKNNEKKEFDESDNTMVISSERKSIADFLNHTPLISITLSVLCFLGFAGIMKAKGFNLASLALLMMSIGMLLQWRPINFIESAKKGISGCFEIILQFPLFGAIMSIFSITGLGLIFAKSLIGFADAQTLPFFTFLSSAIVNLFIPSGGAEWLVLGEPVLQAAKITGAPLGKTIIAFGYGDALTNLINPFWTLTFMPVMGLLMNIKPSDFIGSTVFICFIFFVVESVIILFI